MCRKTITIFNWYQTSRVLIYIVHESTTSNKKLNKMTIIPRKTLYRFEGFCLKSPAIVFLKEHLTYTKVKFQKRKLNSDLNSKIKRPY